MYKSIRLVCYARRTRLSWTSRRLLFTRLRVVGGVPLLVFNTVSWECAIVSRQRAAGRRIITHYAQRSNGRKTRGTSKHVYDGRVRDASETGVDVIFRSERTTRRALNMITRTGVGSSRGLPRNSMTPDGRNVSAYRRGDRKHVRSQKRRATVVGTQTVPTVRKCTLVPNSIHAYYGGWRFAKIRENAHRTIWFGRLYKVPCMGATWVFFLGGGRSRL